MASMARSSTEDAIAKGSTRSCGGTALRTTNEDLGNLLTGRKALWNEYSKEVTRNAVTPVDTAMAFLNPKAELAKKMGDISKGSRFRTGVGLQLADPSARMRALMGAQAEGVLKSGDLQDAADGARSIYDYLAETARAAGSSYRRKVRRFVAITFRIWPCGRPQTRPSELRSPWMVQWFRTSS
jgi:hypothetical protein